MGEEFEVGKVYAMVDGKWVELGESATLELAVEDREEVELLHEWGHGEWHGTLEWCEEGVDAFVDAVKGLGLASAEASDKLFDLYIVCQPIVAILHARRAKVKAMRSELKRRRRSARR